MNNIDRTELRIPLSQLTHDVPVEREHVDILKLSIQQVGQLSPLLVWEQGNEVIDGFHRLEALRELREETALCSLMDLSLEQFRDARITSAVTHKGVSFPRVVKWAKESFADTDWAGKIKATKAFQLDRQLSSPKGTRRALREGLFTMDELQDILSWVKGKSQVWGLQPQQIANMLDLAEISSPSLISLVRLRTQPRQEVLTRPMLRAIVEEIPDHNQQEAIARKAMAEKLKEDEVRGLVGSLQRARTPEERQILLSTSWLDLQEQEIRKRKNNSPKLTEEQSMRLDERFMISMCINSLNTASEATERLLKEPINEHPDLAESLASAVHDLSLNLELLKGDHPDVIEQLQQEILRLTEENSKLKDTIGDLDQTRLYNQRERIRKIAENIDKEERQRD